MREKLSLPIGIRGPSGSAKAPPAARSDNVLRKMRRAAHTEQDRTTRRGRCAAGGKDQPAGIARKKGAEPPRRAVFFFHYLALRRRLSSPHADPAKEARADLPAGRAVVPFPCVAPSSPHADPAKEARADLPAGRAVVHASRSVPGRTKKNGAETPFFLLSVYSLEPVSISEPMIIFWKIANRMMTGRTHMTAAAMTGPWF